MIIVKTVDWAKRNIGLIYLFAFEAWVTKKGKKKRVKLIKIGTSLNGNRRLKQFQVALPGADRKTLKKIASFPVFGPYKKEKGYLHHRFENRQVDPIGIKPGSGGKECFDLNVFETTFVFVYLTFWSMVFYLTWTLPALVLICMFTQVDEKIIQLLIDQ